jgi:hypothetical protein
MLLDVNTVSGSCERGKRVRCTFYSSVFCLYLHAPLGIFNRPRHGGVRHVARRHGAEPRRRSSRLQVCSPPAAAA